MISNPVSRFERAVNNTVRHALTSHMPATLAKELGLGKYIKYDEAIIIGGIYGNWDKRLSRVSLTYWLQVYNLHWSGYISLTYLVTPWLANRVVYLYYTSADNMNGCRENAAPGSTPFVAQTAADGGPRHNERDGKAPAVRCPPTP